MSSESTYQFLVLLLAVAIVLELVARRMRLPPAAALIVGGIVLALIPGAPTVEINPELVLLIFLPPLLMRSAYFTVWREFKRYFVGIASLAVGAVVFTTLSVGVVFHLLFPQLPWAAGFALGAIVAPPDAVSASAVLERLHLPGRITALIEGESLVNDASGLVLFRFAVAAALTGSFSLPDAFVSFSWDTLGGIGAGLLSGWIGLFVISKLHETQLIITATLLLAVLSYIAAEQVGSSGVLSTVTTGLLLGWHQHETFSASTRLRTHAFWQALAFLMESLLFIFIGLSLRGVLNRIGGLQTGLADLAVPLLWIIATVILARFLWLFGSAALRRLVPSKEKAGEVSPMVAATIIGWAGMRGVVTLAGALSLPMQMPGRDIILVSAFSVIIVTVLLQGVTLGPLVKILKVANPEEKRLAANNEALAWKRVASAQYLAVKQMARSKDGSLAHPRLLEQYKHRADAASRYEEDQAMHKVIKSAHFEAVILAIKAGRKEIFKMHRAGEINENAMRHLERQLDLQELAAEERL